MGIEIQVRTPGRSVLRKFPGNIVHLGGHPPGDKPHVALPPGRQVADDHGKIFWSQAGFCYLNLTEAPTILSRSPDFEAELNIFFPQCTLREGDRLRVGETTLQVQRLVPPPFPLAAASHGPALGTGVEFTLVVPEIGAPRSRSASAIELAARLRHLWDRHEVFRRAVDWLRERLLRTLRPRPPATSTEATVQVWHLRRDQAAPAPAGFRHPSAAPPLDWVDWRAVAASPTALAGCPFVITEQKARRPRRALGLGLLAPPEQANGSRGALTDVVVVDIGTREATQRRLIVLRDFADEVAHALSTLEVRERFREYQLRLGAARIAAKCFHDCRHWCTDVQRAVRRAAQPDLPPPDRDRALQATGPVLHKLHRMITAGEHVIQWNEAMTYQESDLAAMLRDELVPIFADQCAIQLRAPDEPLAFCHDPFGIWRALYNVLHNAVRKARVLAPERRPRVAIWAGRQERPHAPRALPYAAVIVADNGPGMEPPALQTLFGGQFLHADGRGLGTAVVADQVRRHHGRIEVASERGAGTAVGMLLPYLTTLAADQRPAPEALEPYADFLESSGFVLRWPRLEDAARELPIFAQVREMLR